METVQIKDKRFGVYISSEEIQTKVKALADAINADYANKNPLIIGVLNGSFIFCADLFRELTVPAEVSFIRMASYEGTSSSGNVKQILGLSDNVFKRDIIIVEDIIDSGLTMKNILSHFKERGAKSVEVASLLVKPGSIKNKVEIKYCGFEIPDAFVVGYGLDYDKQGRNLKDIYQLKEE
ncbi:hypoxanthine phosphoribosyltransferase [Roseivirga pacifica]|uniref:Hypoxanthine phosphoribosyltransferase n=1 Tax=Roseivirga pacifica TaxID=1267423 RepID=A0A1I0NED1_9BACT|nr:hypoxanthine phosphoribosyltransferase [Roseivirga pacifica]MCO6359663.1 hypoxanthine phosphoribosyltransferase [Roseivirga pacifica]MCO6367033.1 hypoxanthine phosphoribosyltransferase [Roseivirga pacifica]MCO6370435.1 hypoxanthine phosphoribosyltransferase [Roseivirga pacifica]MCO6374690.1 hypoxanthine phosphoribosyltransferase [Roseivirga pacifica]MCO6379948.1 hypoxanthine phosphoribosyltransferase [Roseivirga pacifica]